MSEAITHNELLARMAYDPETGLFTYLVNTGSGRAKVGSVIGGRKYQITKINYKHYQLSRLAWFHVHGIWPGGEIDHINGDPTDNRICNLRVASRSQNLANRRRARNNESGWKGVHKRSHGWEASIRHNWKYHYLGTFKSPEEAHAAYCEAARNFFGDFARGA